MNLNLVFIDTLVYRPLPRSGLGFSIVTVKIKRSMNFYNVDLYIIYIVTPNVFLTF